MTREERLREFLADGGRPGGHIPMWELWDSARQAFGIGCTRTHLVEVQPMIFGDDIVTAPFAFPHTYTGRWSYQPGRAAFDAAWVWLATGCAGEPHGWHRHPGSGRRRPGGDPAQEHIRL